MASCSENTFQIVSDNIAFFLGYTATWSDKMPVAGLPNVLENMVMSVLKTHCLKTWNLFHEENGNLTFRLKFEQIEESPVEQHSEVSGTENHRTISFKKKNTKQILRDNARSRKRRRIRQSVSSIESYREQNTENQSDILNSGIDIQANEEDFLESTRHILDTPVLEERILESDENRDISLVNSAHAQIEIPPSPENIEENYSESEISDQSGSDEKNDDDDDDRYDISEENEIGNRLCAKLDELIKKMDGKLEIVSSDSDSDT